MCKYLKNKCHKCGYVFQYSYQDIYEQIGLFENEYFVVCAKCGKHIKLGIEEVQYLTIGRKKDVAKNGKME